MRKLKLPEVTLICLTNTNFEGHKRALDISCEGIEWGGVKLIWDPKIKDIDDWNYQVVFKMWHYVHTQYAMLIHADGFIINPQMWNPEWLKYDYVGAPWPLPTDNYSYRDANKNIVRVGNSVSLRSRKILTYPAIYDFEWNRYFGNTNEDGYLCCHQRERLEFLGAKFAPIEVAKHFSRELDIPENMDVEEPFAFHMHDTMPGRNEQYKKLLI